MWANDKEQHNGINEMVDKMNDFHDLVLSKIPQIRNYVSDPGGTVINHCAHGQTEG